MKNIWAVFFVSMLLWGCKSSDQPKVLIAASANMQYAIKEIASSFTIKTGIDCEIIVGSSGKLMAQIKEGAPYQVFISADLKYPEALYKQGLTTDQPEIYTYGTLVLWSTDPSVSPSIEILSSDKIKHIAIANPEIAPYGQAAINILKHYKIYDELKGKLVFGESISQTNQFIFTGASKLGFTAKSVVLASQIKGKGKWISIPQNSYTPIAQAAVLIKQQKDSNIAQDFYCFLFSSESRKILENFGYLVPEKS